MHAVGFAPGMARKALGMQKERGTDIDKLPDGAPSVDRKAEAPSAGCEAAGTAAAMHYAAKRVVGHRFENGELKLEVEWDEGIDPATGAPYENTFEPLSFVSLDLRRA